MMLLFQRLPNYLSVRISRPSPNFRETSSPASKAETNGWATRELRGDGSWTREMSHCQNGLFKPGAKRNLVFLGGAYRS